MHKVIVFGSLNMDISVACEHFPEHGQTVLGSGMVSTPGGKGANQAVACARMGADTFMLGTIGHDMQGRRLLVSLARHGVSTENISLSSLQSTGCALVMRSQGDSRIVVNPGANLCCSFDEVRAAIHGFGQDRNIFLTQLECDFDVTMEALRCANRNYLYTVLNASPARQLPLDVWQIIDLLCVNESECEALSGIVPSDDEQCLQALRYFENLGVKNTVITLGAQGSVTLYKGEFFHIFAPQLEVVDVTGAGDAYLGALCASLSMGEGLLDGMKLATAAAALCVGRIGAQDALPTWEEASQLVSTMQKYI